MNMFGIRKMEEELQKPKFGSRKTPNIKIIDSLDLGEYILLTTDDIEEYKYRIFDIENKRQLFNSVGFSDINEALCVIIGKKYFQNEQAITNLIKFT